MKIGLNSAEYDYTTLAEFNIIAEAYAINEENRRRELFVLAELFGWAFNDPKNMPCYEDIFKSPKKKEVNENNTMKPWQIMKAKIDSYANKKNPIIRSKG